jgi:hypothetical protein
MIGDNFTAKGKLHIALSSRVFEACRIKSVSFNRVTVLRDASWIAQLV